jgi:hypothetical protein
VILYPVSLRHSEEGRQTEHVRPTAHGVKRSPFNSFSNQRGSVTLTGIRISFVLSANVGTDSARCRIAALYQVGLGDERVSLPRHELSRNHEFVL